MIPKFDKGELKIIGEFPTAGTAYGYPNPPSPIYDFPVTPKENFKLFMKRKDFYWVPDLVRDFNFIYPDIVPDCFACKFEGGIDSFGVEWVPTHPELFLPSFVQPGNPLLKDIEDWENVIKFPDVDSWDWEGSAKLYSVLDPRKPNLGVIVSGYFERLIALMDFQFAAMALVEDPDSVIALMEKMADYNISILEHYKKYYDVDVVIVHDDWGAQKAPFFSRAALQETILPSYKRLVDRAHELGVYVVSHCCGNSEGFVPDMIDIGTDIWQLQVNSNPNIAETIAKYGDRIFFDIYDTFNGKIEEAPEFIEGCYKNLTKSKHVTYNLSDANYNPVFNEITYEASRKICSGEL